ncbi:hypothetical protein BDD12DRAFT_849768 [Trichophaea hybrida]|nr:hypothetical protein BDD12DRAFT_849768 [Trichophaea hybrida]
MLSHICPLGSFLASGFTSDNADWQLMLLISVLRKLSCLSSQWFSPWRRSLGSRSNH